MPKTFELAFTCLDVPLEDVGELHAMIGHAVDVAWSTFAKHCDWQPLAKQLGYEVGKTHGLHMKDDWSVKLKSSTWKGQRCFYVDWSRIEHVFLEPKQ